MNFKNFSLIAFIIALFAILFLALTPSTSMEIGYFPADKINHFIAFFVLYSLAIASFPKLSYLKIFLGLAFIGAMIEFLQSVPIIHRDMEFNDFLVEIIAMAIVQAVITAVHIRKSN